MARPIAAQLAVLKASLFAILVALVAINRPIHSQIAWLNVGQGLAVYFQSESGWNMLYDTGPARAVAPEIGQTVSPLVRQIDLVIISHEHADHLEGLLAILDSYSVKELWLPPLSENHLSLAIRKKLDDRPETIVRERSAGDLLVLPGGLLLRHWHPTSHGQNGHDATQVVELTDQQGHRLLLTGDLDEEQERDALRYCQARQICSANKTILQVSHHGSKTSTADGWLAATQPNIAVISVGENKYGHPAEETLDRLNQSKVEVLRTDRDSRVLTSWPSKR